MVSLTYPLQFFVVALAGWIHQQQRDVIDYLQAENRVLREQLGPSRLRFTDDQRTRLAAKAKTLGRRALTDLKTIVTPDTLLAWHRALIARKTTATFGEVQDGRPSRRRSGSGSSGWQGRIPRGVTRAFKEPWPT